MREGHKQAGNGGRKARELPEHRPRIGRAQGGGILYEGLRRNDEFGYERIVFVSDPKTGMQGVCAVHNTALGPAKGGIRMVRDLSAWEVQGLSEAMTWKNAMADLPLGGGKSGIFADGQELSRPENLKRKEEIVRSFARAIAPLIPNAYVPGPDMYMDERAMGWIAQELGGRACTGKPASMAGLPHELGSTGYGVAVSTQVAMDFMGEKLDGKTVAIEGYGNVGTFAHKFLELWGARVVAVSDSRGAICDEGGLSQVELLNTKMRRGTVAAHLKGSQMEPSSLFGMDVDILIPGARPDVINSGNYRGVKARLIVPGANLPIAHEVEIELRRLGVLVIPDFVANPGGVISSYCEMMQWGEERMFQEVFSRVGSNTRVVLERAQRDNTDTRTAALAIAKERVKAAMDGGK